MLIKSLLSSNLLLLRCFSSFEPHVLGIGDILRQTSIYSSEDVLEYSKVNYDSNPLHFNSEAARNIGFDDQHIHGTIFSDHFLPFCCKSILEMKFLVTSKYLNLRQTNNRYLEKFLTKCAKNGELRVLDGETMTILPTLAVEQVQSMAYRS